MLLSFFSRSALQMGYYAPGPHRTPLAGQASFLDEGVFSGGDILRAGALRNSERTLRLENAGRICLPQSAR